MVQHGEELGTCAFVGRRESFGRQHVRVRPADIADAGVVGFVVEGGQAVTAHHRNARPGEVGIPELIHPQRRRMIAGPAQLIHHFTEDPDRPMAIGLPQVIEQRLERAFEPHRFRHAVVHELTQRFGDADELNVGAAACQRLHRLVGARPRNHDCGLVMTNRMREELGDRGVQVQVAVVELRSVNSRAGCRVPGPVHRTLRRPAKG